MISLLLCLGACHSGYEGPYEPDIEGDHRADEGLKGNVRTVRERMYRIRDSIAFPEVIPDSLVPWTEELTEFDEKGRRLWKENWQQGERLERREFRYDEEGKMAGISVFDELGEESTVQFKYNSGGKCIEQQSFNPDGALLSRTKYRFDNEGRCVESEHLYYEKIGDEEREIDGTKNAYIFFESGVELVRVYRNGYHFASSLIYEGLERSVQTFDSSGTLVEATCIHYDSTGHSVSRTRRNAKGDTVNQSLLSRDAEGHVLSDLMTGKEGVLTAYRDFVIDSLGEVVRMREWFSSLYKGKEISTDTTAEPNRTSHYRREYDPQGNWTRYEIWENGSPGRIYLRVFDYYK